MVTLNMDPKTQPLQNHLCHVKFHDFINFFVQGP